MMDGWHVPCSENDMSDFFLYYAFSLLFILAALPFAAVHLGIAGKFFDPNARRKKMHREWIRAIGAGLISVLVLDFIYGLLPGNSSWFLYGGEAAFLPALIDNLFRVGPVEEGLKFLLLLVLVSRSKKITEPLDYALLGAFTGLGFALFENAGYTLMYGMDTFFMRNILVSPGHMLYTAISGALYGGLIWYAPVRRPGELSSLLPYLAWTPAVILHALYKSLLYLPGMESQVAGYFYILFFDGAVFLILYSLVKNWSRRGPYYPYPLNRAAEAEGIISHALMRSPDSFVLNKRLGYYRLAQEKISTARPPLVKAARLGPHSKTTQLLALASELLEGASLPGSSGKREDSLRRFEYLFARLGPEARARFTRTLIRLMPRVDVRKLGGEYERYFRTEADRRGWTEPTDWNGSGRRVTLKRNRYLAATPVRDSAKRR
jgi:RsiW-degrading membrane proteinase PrsW (M82 family)